MRYATAMGVDYPGFHDFELAGWEDSDVARHYEQTIAALTRQSNEPLLDSGGVVAGSRLLDVACGPGFLTSAAARRGAHAIGVDFSSAQVTGAARRHPGLRFELADASALPFPDASFDAVLTNFGMLHFPDAARAAAEACRVLVPGGRFAFTVWDQPERVVAMGALLRAIRTHGTLDIRIPAGPDFFALSEPLRSQELLRVAGFESPTVEYVRQVWQVGAPEEVFEAFQRATVRMGALLRAQSAEQSSRIRAALRDELDAYRGADGYELPMPALLVTGHKPGRA
jgi:ubiquinone/menaquinone biosynthesis C-methylase UbiE